MIIKKSKEVKSQNDDKKVKMIIKIQRDGKNMQNEVKVQNGGKNSNDTLKKVKMKLKFKMMI